MFGRFTTLWWKVKKKCSRSIRSQLFFRISVLKIFFAIFTGKHLFWRLIIKGDPNTGIFLWIFLITAFFKEHLRWLLLCRGLPLFTILKPVKKIIRWRVNSDSNREDIVEWNCKEVSRSKTIIKWKCIKEIYGKAISEIIFSVSLFCFPE